MPSSLHIDGNMDTGEPPLIRWVHILLLIDFLRILNLRQQSCSLMFPRQSYCHERGPVQWAFAPVKVSIFMLCHAAPRLSWPQYHDPTLPQ